MTKVFIAADHAGVELKKQVVEFFSKNHPEYVVVDHGPMTTDSVDYPDYADKVCHSLKENPHAYGVLICGSAQGMAIRANKFKHIRAALVYNEETVQLAREHNNANVLCIGARFCNAQTAEKWINIFLNTKFSEGRHTARVAKISGPTS